MDVKILDLSQTGEEGFPDLSMNVDSLRCDPCEIPKLDAKVVSSTGYLDQIRKYGVTIFGYTGDLICRASDVTENGKIVLAGSGKELLETQYIKKAYLGI